MTRLAEKEAKDPTSHWRNKVDSLKQFQGGRLDGFIDTSAGVTYADKVGFRIRSGILAVRLT